jgi:cytochrome c biogenesis protein
MLSKIKNLFISFFSSLKLTIVLLLIIAIVSILGTVIPQGVDVSGKIESDLLNTCKFLQLFDVYHSLWFILLMVLLSLNLIVCSLKKAPAAWKLYNIIPSPDRKKPFENLPLDRTLRLKKDKDHVIDIVKNLLLKKFKRFRKKDSDEITFMYGEKGAFSHFGVYIIHVSILIIIAGAIVGSLMGFEGIMNIPEGESTDTARIVRPNTVKKFDFTVRCDNFSIEYYSNGMPKEYRSNLSFIKDNKVAYQGPLLVNHPITFQDIRFYQASYGKMPGGKAHLTIKKGDENPNQLTAMQNDSFYFKEEDAAITIERVEKNFMNIGPAVLIAVQTSDTNFTFWVIKNVSRLKSQIPGLLEKFPKFDPGSFKPYNFTLTEIEDTYYTGIQLSHDPGVSIVATGSFIIIIGIFVTFFSSHKKIWVRVEGEGEQVKLSVAGTSSKDPVALQREIDNILKNIKNELGEA